MEELMEQIGTSAGEIYNYLNTNGTTTFSKMKKELDLKGNCRFRSWLVSKRRQSIYF